MREWASRSPSQSRFSRTYDHPWQCTFLCSAFSTNRFCRCAGDKFWKKLDHAISLLLEKWHVIWQEGSCKKVKGPSSVIRYDKRRLVQERLLPPIPKVFRPWGSRLRHKRSLQRDLRKPLRVTIFSTQTDSSEVLLAHHAKGCPDLCQNLRQVSNV